MKKDSDELYQLICTLTAREKKYCTLYLKSHNVTTDSKYLKLFNYLQKAAHYDSAATIKKMGYVRQPNHYAVIKRRLYEQVLDALYQFALTFNEQEQLLRGIFQCRLLAIKGLHKQCDKKMAVLEKTARDMDFGMAQLSLQNLKMFVMNNKHFSHITDNDLKAWEIQSEEILQALKINARYTYLSSHIIKMQSEFAGGGEMLLAGMKSIMDLPEFTDDSNASTLQAKIRFYNAKTAYYKHNNEPEKCKTCSEKILKLLEENPHFYSFDGTYYPTLESYMDACLTLKQYKLFEIALEKFRAFPVTTASWNKDRENFVVVIFFAGYQHEMVYLIQTGRYQEGYLRIVQIENGIKKFGYRITGYDMITLRVMIAFVCFAVAKYDEALLHIATLVQEPEIAGHDAFQMGLRILQLLCHFEKGDKELVQSLAKSLQRKLMNWRDEDPLQSDILKFFCSATNKTEIERGKWIILQNKLNKLPIGSPSEMLTVLHYRIWARAHVERISFSEAWAKETNIIRDVA